jgi:hypothetical protein
MTEKTYRKNNDSFPAFKTTAFATASIFRKSSDLYILPFELLELVHNVAAKRFQSNAFSLRPPVTAKPSCS